MSKQKLSTGPLAKVTLPKAKSKTRSKQNKDKHKCSSVYSERGVPLPVLTSGGE
jgi:hypothetical protein